MTRTVTLRAGKESALRRRHPWIFAGAVQSHTGRLHPGDTVDICAADGRWLARGAWSPHSQIRVRVWTFDQQEVIDNGFFLRRLQRAFALRERLPELAGCSAMRLVAAESDGLPGMTLDRYENLLVLQLLSAGADKHRDKILWALQSLLPECRVLERSDVAIREKEGLQPLVQAHSEDMPDEITFTEHGHRFLVEAGSGHKTGFYLDQRNNRRRIADYVQGKTVLNCFSYTGAMGVYCLEGGATRLTQVDISADALQLAARHLALNGLDDREVELVEADVFACLREYRRDGRRFDVIILDPPKFVDSKQHLNSACRGYKDINMLAMQLLEADGILATFSCSGLMPEDLFRKVVADAALDAGREVQYLERLGQAADHPVGAAFPEGAYLKGLICRVI